MIRKTALTIVLTLALAHPGSAYEPKVVHYQMTEAAFDAAAAGNDFLQRLAVVPGKTVGGKLPRTWAAEGARDEDNGNNPLSHFFDPENKIRLSIGSCPKSELPYQMRADEYAVAGVAGNLHGLVAARIALVKSLTAPTRDLQEDALGETFKNLGHMMHLVEDMAQPEHTRNDQHFPLGSSTSLYEDFSEYIIRYPPQVNGLPKNYFAGYPVVRHDSYLDYFSTSQKKSGMADFSHYNFITQDTNFHDPVRNCARFNYAEPALPASTRDVHRIETVKNGFPTYSTTTKLVKITFFDAAPIDAYQNTPNPARPITVRSYLDFETRKYLDPSDPSSVAPYSENDEIYLHKADVLIPRAVGYAAGLVDLFFSGRMDVEWTRTQDPYTYTVGVMNRSAKDLTGARMEVWLMEPGAMGGITKVITLSLPDLAANGARVVLPASVSGMQLPANKTILDYERRIVIRGRLGAEDGAVIGLVQPPTNGTLFAYRANVVNGRTGLMTLGVDAAAQWRMVRQLHPVELAWDPFGTYTIYGSLAPDTLQAATTHYDELGPIYITDTTAPVFVPRPLILRAADGKQIGHRGYPRWTYDSAKVVIQAQRPCMDHIGDPVVCAKVGYRSLGVAVMDPITGVAGFHHFPDLIVDRQWPTVETVSRNGQYAYGFDQTGIARYDLFTNTIQRGVAPRGRLEANRDGSVVYILSDFSSGVPGGLWAYSWNGGVLTHLAANIDYWSDFALSPSETEIAYPRVANRTACNAGSETWVFNIPAQTERLASDTCTAESVLIIDMHWLP